MGIPGSVIANISQGLHLYSVEGGETVRVEAWECPKELPLLKQMTLTAKDWANLKVCRE